MGRESQLAWAAPLRAPEPPPEDAPRPPELTWRQTARAVLPAFLLTRLVTLVAGVAGVLIWGIKDVEAVYDPAGLTVGLGGLVDTLVAPYARWDAVWFLDIAHVGYPTSYAPRTAFFPLYPVLLNVGGFVLRSPLIAGLVISTACAFVGAMIVHRLTDRELGRPAAGAAVWVLLAFPGSLWLTAVYSEGLFLLLSAGCLLAARDRRWAIAGVLGALAAATRSAGVVLVVPILVMAWDAHRQDLLAARRRDPREGPPPAEPSAPPRWAPLAAAAAVPLGLIVFVVGLVLAGHEWTASFDQQREWGRDTVGPIAGVVRAVTAAGEGLAQLLGVGDGTGASTPGAEWMNPLLLVFLALAIAALVGAARRLPPAYAAYVGCALVLPLSAPAVGGGEPLMSLPRFLGVLFPLAMWTGWWLTRGPRRRERQVVLLVVGLGLLAVFSTLTARWSFVA
jgi:hypothetical protein